MDTPVYYHVPTTVEGQPLATHAIRTFMALVSPTHIPKWDYEQAVDALLSVPIVSLCHNAYDHIHFKTQYPLSREEAAWLTLPHIASTRPQEGQTDCHLRWQ